VVEVFRIPTLSHLEGVFHIDYRGSMTTEAERPRRADAIRNREAILTSAREIFTADGLQVPMSVVARRAGVGIATLSRNFADRDELVAAVFAAEMTAYADAAEAALTDPDPWHGFCTFVETACALQSSDRGFTAVLAMTFPRAGGLEAERARAFRSFVTLVRAAKAAGRLRRDFSPEDLPIILMANAGVVTAAGIAAPAAARRLLGYVLQACSAEHTEPLPKPPTPRQMYEAMTSIQTPGHQ
jgi:AcrR family transcriptional regulator